MEDTLDLLEELNIPIPIDIMVKAVESYGFILENSFEQEDLD